MTPDGMLSPTRILYGTTKRGFVHASDLVIISLPELSNSILYWFDSVLINTPSPERLLAVINLFFDGCVAYNTKMYPAECILFATFIRWCYCLLSADDIRFDPKQLSVLAGMKAYYWQQEAAVCAMKCL